MMHKRQTLNFTPVNHWEIIIDAVKPEDELNYILKKDLSSKQFTGRVTPPQCHDFFKGVINQSFQHSPVDLFQRFEQKHNQPKSLRIGQGWGFHIQNGYKVLVQDGPRGDRYTWSYNPCKSP